MATPPKEPCILVVEDDESFADLIQALLNRAGYSVVVAVDDHEMDVALNARRPDLILLDLMLPGRDGFELLRQLKSDVRSRDIPVIIVSGRTGNRDQVQAFDFGAADFIAKPFAIEELAKRINRVLAGKRAGTPQ